jgi:hypothetical protein
MLRTDGVGTVRRDGQHFVLGAYIPILFPREIRERYIGDIAVNEGRAELIRASPAAHTDT